MGFVSDVLNGETGLHWYNIIGLILFIVLFIGLFYKTLRMSRSKLTEYKESIFDPEDIDTEESN